MGVYQHSEHIAAPADEVFAFVSDFDSMASYLPTVRSVSKQQGDLVTMRGEVGGHTYEGTGYVRVDRARRRMEWGSDGDSEYSGWLEIAHGANDSAEVVVELRFGADSAETEIQRQTGDREAAIHQGMERALQQIREAVEGHGGRSRAAQA